MARSRPAFRDHDAVVMDVGDPAAPSPDDEPGGDRSDDRGPGARGTRTATARTATPAEAPVDPPGDGGTMDPVSMDPVSMDPVSMDPDRAVDDPGGPDGRDDTSGRDGRGWVVPSAVVVLVVALATAGWTLLRDDPQPDLAWWSAPTTPVVERWSMEMSTMQDGLSQAIPVGDDLLVQRRRRRPDGGLGTDVVLERRDGHTGDVTWSRPGRRDDLLLVMDGDRPTSRLLYPLQGPRRVVGIDGATGEELWTQPANDQSWGGVTAAGDLWVTGDRGCGLVHPPTGRMLFTVGRDAADCGPAGDGLAFSNGDERVVVDRTGDVVDRVSTGVGYAWAVYVDGLTISITDGDLVAREPDGTERWRRRLGAGQWYWAEPVGPDLLFVGGEGETLLVRRADGVVATRVDGQVDPLVTAEGRVRLVADRSRTSPAEASGVWSRSPDAADYALLDDTGEVLGTQDLVLTGWPIATAQGVLTLHGPDDRRRMSLFDPDDLSVRWQVPLALRNGEVVASSESLVVVEGSRDGRTEVMVFGPED